MPEPADETLQAKDIDDRSRSNQRGDKSPLGLWLDSFWFLRFELWQQRLDDVGRNWKWDTLGSGAIPHCAANTTRGEIMPSTKCMLPLSSRTAKEMRLPSGDQETSVSVAHLAPHTTASWTRASLVG